MTIRQSTNQLPANWWWLAVGESRVILHASCWLMLGSWRFKVRNNHGSWHMAEPSSIKQNHSMDELIHGMCIEKPSELRLYISQFVTYSLVGESPATQPAPAQRRLFLRGDLSLIRKSGSQIHYSCVSLARIASNIGWLPCFEIFRLGSFAW